MAKRINKELMHDALVQTVKNELEWRGYDDLNIETFTNYTGVKCGEIDLYAVKENYILLFEIKNTYLPSTVKKSTEQLNRAVDNYLQWVAPEHRVFKLMAYYDTQAIDGWDTKWIK